jgi:type IV pilus assembly protein PilX
MRGPGSEEKKMTPMTSMARFQTGPRSSQGGATLIVGLVLLLVLTVLGVSGMNTATMELQMAANTQFQQDAFQMTEDAVDIVIGTRNYGTNAATVLDWTGAPDYDRRALTTYRGNTPVPDAAYSASEVEAFHFDIQAWGKGPRNATSNQVQSFYVIGRAL